MNHAGEKDQIQQAFGDLVLIKTTYVVVFLGNSYLGAILLSELILSTGKIKSSNEKKNIPAPSFRD